MLVLEALFEPNKERVLQFNEDALLGHNVFFLVLLDDVLLLKDLHGINLMVLCVPNEEYLSIGAFADDGEGFIVLDASFLHDGFL